MHSLFSTRTIEPTGIWKGPESEITSDPGQILEALRILEKPCFILNYQDQIAVTSSGKIYPLNEKETGISVLANLRSQSPENFGTPGFLTHHGVKFPYMAGSMANAISNESLVTALGNAGMLASFGAGGVSPDRLLKGINTIKTQLPDGPYAFNLIHSPNEPLLEQKAVDLYLENQIQTIEASAFLRLTPTVVEFRVAGLSQADGKEYAA